VCLTPTCTGLGDRAHLLTANVSLQTFIEDVVATTECEELEDVVLVGHSFGGLTALGVVDRIPGRVRRLVLLDALVVGSGESAYDVLIEERPAIDAARRRGLTLPVPDSDFGLTDPGLLAWVRRRLTPHPVRTYTDSLLLDHPPGGGVPTVYVECVRPRSARLLNYKQRTLRSSRWPVVELAECHDALVSVPSTVAALIMDQTTGH